jgi:hypothetical protein
MITQPKFFKLNTDAFFGFYTDVVKSIKRYPNATLIAYTEPIEAMYLQLNAGYKLGRKNEITTELKALDKQRDLLLGGLKKILKGNTVCPQPDKAQAATRLLYVLNKYGNIARLTYSEQSGASRSLLNEWKEPILKDGLELLGLKDWIEHLELIQEKFATRYLDRAAEDATKKAVPISKLIPDAIKLYQNFVLMLIAFYQMNSAEYAPLVRLLDELGKKYNEAMRNEALKNVTS